MQIMYSGFGGGVRRTEGVGETYAYTQMEWEVKS
jgi:hypothetical protein